MEFSHKPVLLDECIGGLNIVPQGIYVDCTLGGAGHSSEILRRLSAGGRLIAFDKDPEARQIAAERLSKVDSGATFDIVPSDFSQIREKLYSLGIDGVNGILADLGVSSHQIDTPERGFSFRYDGPLDMRMDFSSGITAADIVNNYSAEKLIDIFRKYGEERYSRQIAEGIIRRRQKALFTSTLELSDTIINSVPSKARHEKQHPAKRVFQALRIEVNHELDSLECLLDNAYDCLIPGGRLVIITFHSLEDRCVKQTFKKWEHPCECPPKLPCVCGKKPLGKAFPTQGIVAGEEELKQNPRAHSARARVFIKKD